MALFTLANDNRLLAATSCLRSRSISTAQQLASHRESLRLAQSAEHGTNGLPGSTYMAQLQETLHYQASQPSTRQSPLGQQRSLDLYTSGSESPTGPT